MIDLEELRLEIRGLKRHQKLYKVLKEELSKLGYWKLKSRGNPQKGYKNQLNRQEGLHIQHVCIKEGQTKDCKEQKKLPQTPNDRFITWAKNSFEMGANCNCR